MDALEAILTRRSIRNYAPKSVREKDIDVLLRAAMQAPSANNLQPWHFILLDDKGILLAIPKFHPYAEMLKQASSAIVVCGDTKKETRSAYLIQDCSAATQNILLAAHALGLGAVWLGVYPKDERVTALAKLLSLPEHIIPVSLVSLGIPAEKKPFNNRFKASRIHRNGW